MKRGRAAPKGRPTKRPRVTPAFVKKAVARATELKNLDTTLNTRIVAAQTTATVGEVFSPDAGTDPTEHVGRTTKEVSLEYFLQASYAATTAGSSPIRLAIVYDRQTNAALPTITDVWESDSINTLRNLANSKRFKILVDQKFQGMSDAGSKTLSEHGFRKFKFPLETNYNQTNGGTIADITTGSFISYVWQNGNIITANPIAVLTTRVRFIDA